MKRTFTLLLGIAAGAALASAMITTERGKELRSNVAKRANDLKNRLVRDIKDKAKAIHDSEVTYI